jgi:hypothetical protein
MVFFSYVFNLGGLQTSLDGLFSGLDSSARSHETQVSRFFVAAIPYVIVAMAALILFIVLGSIVRGARTLGKSQKLRNRERVTVAEFLETAGAHGVSRTVAREVYDMLLPYYDNQMRVALSDRLRTTLQLKPVEVSDLYGNLLRHTDRHRRVGEDGARIETVLDLLTAVEGATPRSLPQSELHRRDEPGREAMGRRRPSLGARIKASLLHTVQPNFNAAPKDEASVIKPVRLAVRELDMRPKSARRDDQSPAA